MKRQERGFALLMVFLMAAAISIMLYRQLPRVAFESQRDKDDDVSQQNGKRAGYETVQYLDEWVQNVGQDRRQEE